MKAQLNQSNAMIPYDGDYSFLNNEESTYAPESSASNSLMWLKIAGYKQKKSQPAKNIVRHDLMWLKVDGYEKPGSESKMEAMKMKMYSIGALKETVYERIQLLKARHQFYFSALTMLVLLNLVFFLSVFTR
ncbi:MAG: hypothetical protein ABI855_02850 [Bacteroidota bacterium]